ncbi:hypothetical protein MKX01_035473 [Papaver californicum]|nr:hypothetical protein MKX01_035473 [Papaver californicum]
MVSLPIEILSEILIQLPLKSIARFRCTRYQHSIQMDKFSLMLCSYRNIDTLSYDPLSSVCEGSSHVICPNEFLEMGIAYHGCCNGLVLLLHNKYQSYVLMLWNPCTNECKRIPNPPGASKDQDRIYVEYGFGYDYQIEDFKVVCLADSLEKIGCEVHVYTLKSNSWRGLNGVEKYDFDDAGKFDMARMPVNGSLHWIVYGGVREFRSDHFILCFDIEKEEFDKMPLHILDDADGPLILCVLGGSLCLLSYDSEVISVWELKDDGVKKSWAKLFTIELEKHFGVVINFVPLKSLENGKIMLGLDLDDDCFHIVIYDPNQNTILDIYEYSMDCYRSVAVYVESLISLDTGTYLGPPQWEASHEENEDDYKEDEEDDDVVTRDRTRTIIEIET